MAQRYLGDTFDIHGGGLDLRFPHHENEQAQSRAAGYGFAQYWLHNGWVTQGGAKMSKSLGNGLLVTVVLAKERASVLRYAMTAVQYSSMLEWTDDTLREAEATWDRLAGLRRARRREGGGGRRRRGGRRSSCPPTSSPRWTTTSTCRPRSRSCTSTCGPATPRSRAGDLAEARDAMVVLRAMLDVLGLDPGGSQWRAHGSDARYARALEAVVAAELEARAAGPRRPRLRHVRRDPGPPRRGRHRGRGLVFRSALVTCRARADRAEEG